MPVGAVPLFLSLAQAPVAEGITEVRAPRAAHLRTDTAADVVVVTAEELRATGERSLPRQLAKAAGVWIQETNLGGGSPLLQGLSGNQVLLVLDGVRMNDATTRNGVNQMLNGIDPETVDRVEVIRGPRSVQYGTDALGGVVLVWTKRRPPPREGAAPRTVPDGEISGRSDSTTDGFTGALTLSGELPKSGWLATGSYHHWNDLETGDGTVSNTGYDGDGLFAAWEQALDPLRSLRATVQITRDYDVPRTDRLNVGFGQTAPANEEFLFKIEDRQRFILAYDDREATDLYDVFQTRLSYRHYDEQREIRATGSSTRRKEQDLVDSFGLGFDMKKALGERHLLTYGADVDQDFVDSTREDVDITTGTRTPNDGAFAPNSRATAAGVFVQDEIALAEAWDLTLGGRYGYHAFHFEDPVTAVETDDSFHALGASAALGRRVGERSRVVATLAHGYRAPNLAELAREASFSGGTELPNPDLDPEQSLYAELAWETRASAWEAALAVFGNRITDAVGRILIDPGGPGLGDETYLRQNVGEVDIFGVQARGRTRLGGPESPWSVHAAIEYAYGKQHDDFVDPATGTKPFDDEPAQRIPPLNGWASLRREYGLEWMRWSELTLGWALGQDRLSPQDLDDPRIDPSGTDGWARFDIDVGGPIGKPPSRAEWMVGLHNLFDAEYRVHGSGMDAPGTGLVVALRMSF